jgi:hypothetical protein
MCHKFATTRVQSGIDEAWNDEKNDKKPAPHNF